MSPLSETCDVTRLAQRRSAKVQGCLRIKELTLSFLFSFLCSFVVVVLLTYSYQSYDYWGHGLCFLKSSSPTQLFSIWCWIFWNETLASPSISPHLELIFATWMSSLSHQRQRQSSSAACFHSIYIVSLTLSPNSPRRATKLWAQLSGRFGPHSGTLCSHISCSILCLT